MRKQDTATLTKSPNTYRPIQPRASGTGEQSPVLYFLNDPTRERKEPVKKITINITEEQSRALDVMSEVTGVTKNGLICLAIHEWLTENAPQLLPTEPKA